MRSLLYAPLAIASACFLSGAISPPTNIVTRTGDRSIVLHWDRSTDAAVAGYKVYRKDANAIWVPLNASAVTSPSFADLNVTNDQIYSYAVRAVTSASQESSNSESVSATPREFPADEAFLEYVEQTAFDYFWYEANPANGLVRDRSTPTSPCSIAAVGFGLTAIGIGIDRGWITREQGRARVLTTLKTFWETPQGTSVNGQIGHKGWFYHFLDMNTGLRAWSSELSSIDTALLLGGVLFVKQYFDQDQAEEAQIRQLAGSLFDRIDWNWMANGRSVLGMGWKPESGFLSSTWKGYNEAMILYVFAIGATNQPVAAQQWQNWTSTYTWQTLFGRQFVPFPPLFGHQYSHCWIDFRHVSDAYMRTKASTYFENSRRATLAQRDYCIANPKKFTGYSANVWGLTACDGPGREGFLGYAARGAPPTQNDDGTIAPTAPGGSIVFAPEESIAALRFMYTQYRTNIWTGYGFRDAFNLADKWWDPDVLGIDEGPILLMAENYRSKRVWELFMRNPEVQRGLELAGFKPVAFVKPSVRIDQAHGAFILSWPATADRSYQVEFSPNLTNWFFSSTGGFAVGFSGPDHEWVDVGPPATTGAPFEDPQRFYRVFQLGGP